MHWQDISGEMVDPFVPGARTIDQKTDRRLGGLAATLAECLSMHSAALWLIENQPWDFFAVYYDAIDHFCHGFMRYHPPKQDWISQADFDLYRNVVTAGYQLHDHMLGVMLEKVGDDVTVMMMSDHGFHPDHLRPSAIPDIPAGPAIEHRDFGMFVLKGPGIKRDELVHGASVLDITPTLLTLFGLPVGEDMDGKVLLNAFETPERPTTIPSWEGVPGRDGRHPPHTQLDPIASREALEQLIALGYIAQPDENQEKAVAETVRELRYNLGEAYQDADRHAEALEIFRELNMFDRDEQRFAVHRFVSCQALGLVKEMRTIVEDLGGRRRAVFVQANAECQRFRALVAERRATRKASAEPEAANVEAAAGQDAPADDAKPNPLLTKEEQTEFARQRKLSRFQPAVVDYLMARVLGMEGKHAEALAALERLGDVRLSRPGLFLQAADLYMKLNRWEEAEAVFTKALAIDPDNAHAHLGMCRTHLRRRKYKAAAAAALEALERLYHYPLAHFLLGNALRGMGEHERAAGAYRKALSLNPNFAEAHKQLSVLLGPSPR